MSEALSTILEFIENTMKIKKIEAHISVDNMDSIKLATKHGFVDVKDDYMEVSHEKEYLHRKYVKTF